MPVAELRPISILVRGPNGARQKQPVMARDFGELALHPSISSHSHTVLTHVRSGRLIYRGARERAQALLDILLSLKLDWDFENVNDLGPTGKMLLRQTVLSAVRQI